MINKQLFDEDTKALIGQGKSFKIERSGSFAYLDFDGYRIQYGPENHGGVDGAHLSRMVRADAMERVEFKRTDHYYSEDPPSVYVDQKNISSIVGDYAIQIDMKNCYWKTAFMEGIISKQTYMKGLVNPKWKVGRNAAIGSLDRKTTITYYVDGKEVDSERIVMHRNCRFARQKVIRRVDEIAMSVIKEICLPDEFYMFVTDCFFVKMSAAQKIRDFLNQCNYDYTEASVQFKSHFPQKKLVVWDKIKMDPGADGKISIDRDKNKFIHYTNRSIV